MSYLGERVGAGAAVGGTGSGRSVGEGAAYRLVLVAVVAYVVQRCILDALRIHGAEPDLMVGLVVLVALDGGPRRGALVGFFVGLAVDLLVMTPFGLSALTFTLLGYGVGLLRGGLAGAQGAGISTAVAAGGSIVGTLGYSLLLAVTGVAVPGLGWIVLTVTLVNAILAVPVSLAIRWATGSGSGSRTRARTRSPSALGGTWR